MPLLDLPARVIERRFGGLARGVEPLRIVPLGFALIIGVGTVLLMLPVARTGGVGAPFMVALFTATSATCVTGLSTVDPGSYWSGFGEAVLISLVQIGGLGTLVVTTLLLLALGDRLSIATRRLAGAEQRWLNVGGVEARVRAVLLFTVSVELVVAVALAVWWAVAYDYAPRRAAWHGVFHSISAFNNAGFGLLPDNIIGFSDDPVVLVLLCAAVILGGIGMPVVVEVRRACQARTARASRRLSLHAVLTLGGTVILLAFGTGLIFLLERNATLQGMPAGQAVMNAGVHAVMLRTGGFNAIDLSKLSEAGALASAGLMLVGGGSGGTAGGIKITTLMVLIATVAAELRGRTDVTVRGRRLPSSVQREALALLFLAVAAVGLGATALMALMSLPMRDALFEAVSAFGTVGLTTGVTARLTTPAQVVVIALMFIGRVGPVTLGAALALRARDRRVRYPEERVVVG